MRAISRLGRAYGHHFVWRKYLDWNEMKLGIGNAIKMRREDHNQILAFLPINNGYSTDAEIGMKQLYPRQVMH
jgi:hypothetical protein